MEVRVQMESYCKNHEDTKVYIVMHIQYINHKIKCTIRNIQQVDTMHTYSEVWSILAKSTVRSYQVACQLVLLSAVKQVW